MISIILKIDSLEHVKKSLYVLGEAKKNLESQVKELEEIPRHRISYESFFLTQQTETLNAINIALSELVALNSEINIKKEDLAQFDTYKKLKAEFESTDYLDDLNGYEND